MTQPLSEEQIRRYQEDYLDGITAAVWPETQPSESPVPSPVEM